MINLFLQTLLIAIGIVLVVYRGPDVIFWWFRRRNLAWKARMKPARIILIRHGESKGNVDKAVYGQIPDNQIELTSDGIKQAEQVGVRLRKRIGNESTRFYVSPFKRSRQTFDAICKGGQFDRGTTKGREDPRIREQEWGNFLTVEQQALAKKERERVGAFFFRFEQGESGADVYDRVGSFLDHLFREFQMKPVQNVVIVSHGLFMRLFLMRFFRWSVEKFHRLPNFDNGAWAVLEKVPKGHYVLTEPTDAVWHAEAEDSTSAAVDQEE